MPLVHQRRFIIAVICGGLTLILLMAIGMYGLMQAPRRRVTRTGPRSRRPPRRSRLNAPVNLGRYS